MATTEVLDLAQPAAAAAAVDALNDRLAAEAQVPGDVGGAVAALAAAVRATPLERWTAGPLRDARDQGISVAVENMPREESRRVFSIGRYRSCYLPEHLSGLGDVTLDTSHVGASKVDLIRAYSALAGQLRHVHLSDSDLTGGDQHRLPGKGRLPLRPFLSALARSDYPGVVSLELKPWSLGAPAPETILERMRGALEFARGALADEAHAG